MPSSVESENVFTQSSLIVTLQDPLTLIDEIYDIWNTIGFWQYHLCRHFNRINRSTLTRAEKMAKEKHISQELKKKFKK